MKLINKSALITLFGFLISCYSIGYASDFETEDWLATEVLVSSGDSVYKNLFYYNKFDKMVLSAKYLKSDDGIFKAVNQTEWIYDQQRLTDEIHSEYKSDIAVKKMHINYTYIDNNPDLIVTYDQNNNLVSSIDYFYENNLLKSISESKLENSGLLNLIKQINYLYNQDTITETTSCFKDNKILDSYKLTKISNGKNRLSKVIYQKLVGQIPVNDQQYIYSYQNTVDTMIQSVRQQKWDTNLKVWENSHKTEFIYTNTGKIKYETSYFWSSRFWVENFRNLNEYDSSDNLILKSKQIPLYQKWRTLTSVNYNLSNQSLIAESVYGFWGGDQGKLVRTDMPLVFNNLNVLVNAEKIEVNLVHTSNEQINRKNSDVYLYPNPSQGLMYMSNLQQDDCQVRIFSYDGKLVLQKNIPANSGVLDAGVLQGGNYLLQLKSNQINVNQHITICK